MGVNDDLRIILRWDLNAVLFHDQVEHAAKIIIDDQARVARIVKENHVDYAVKASKDLFGEISSIFGPQAINESIPMNSESEFHSEVFDRSSHMMSSVKQRIVERQSKFHPSTKCIMNGLLVSVKNHEKPEAVFRDFLGFKKTKRRWYELNFDCLSWYGRDGDEEFKGSISVGDITDIRPYSTNSNLGGIHTFGFEVSTVNREFFFGSGDEQSRDDWICDFKLACETYFLRKGYYTHSYRDMTLKDLDYFATLP